MSIRNFSIAMACLIVAACSNGSNDRPAANAAPMLGAIADQSTSANQASAAIDFSVTDENLSSVSFSISSDNQAVVPDNGIVLGGNGANRSITATPVLDMLGDALISIIATDSDGLSDNTSFLLIITPEQESLQQFTRETFADSADGDPALINAVDFAADADNDDFADLLAL